MLHSMESSSHGELQGKVANAISDFRDIGDRIGKIRDWLHEPRDPRCNTQLQSSFFKPKDSFMYPILDCVGNPFEYELHSFDRFCASQRVMKRYGGMYFPLFTQSARVVEDSSLLAMYADKTGLGKKPYPISFHKTDLHVRPLGQDSLIQDQPFINHWKLLGEIRASKPLKDHKLLTCCRKMLIKVNVLDQMQYWSDNRVTLVQYCHA